jgi:hypothetical protein
MIGWETISGNKRRGANGRPAVSGLPVTGLSVPGLPFLPAGSGCIRLPVLIKVIILVLLFGAEHSGNSGGLPCRAMKQEPSVQYWELSQ